MTITTEITDELVRRIVEAVHPIKIILFGSAARGEMGPHSDIDVLVVMPDGTHRRKTAQVIYGRLPGFGLPVDVVVATSGDLSKYADSSALVYKHALKDGRELYAA